MNLSRALPPSPKVFIVEDEALIAMELADRLGRLGYTVIGTAARGEQAVIDLAVQPADIVVMDIHLAGRMNGIEAAARLRRICDVPVVFLSAFSDAEFVQQAGEVGSFGYLVKPFEERELHATLQLVLFKHRTERELKELNRRLEERVRERTAELELLNAALQESDARRREAQWVARLGHWDLDVATGAIKWCDEVYDIFGRDRATFQPTQAAYYEQIVFPADVDAVKREEQAAYGSGRRHQIDHRFIHPDGTVRWVHLDGHAILDAAGRPFRLSGTVQDVTDRKRIEESFREGEERLAVTLSSITDGVLATDAAGCVIQMNAVAEHLTGWSAADAVGRPVEEVFRTIHEATRLPTIVPVKNVLASARAMEVANHTLLVAKDGTERPITDSAAPMRGRSGQLIGVVLVFRDQSKERETQRLLEERERLLSSIIQNLVGSFVFRAEREPNGAIEFKFVSPGVEEITGLPPDAVVNDRNRLLSAMADQSHDATGTGSILRCQDGRLFDEEVCLRHAKSHVPKWLRLRGQQVERREDGTEVLEGIAFDITGAKKAAAENRKLAMVAARTHNGVVLADGRARIEWVNEGFTRITGYAFEEVRGRVPGSFLQGPETDPAVVEEIRRNLRAQQGFKVELLNYAKGGRKYWVEIEVQPLHDERGRLTHYMAVERDLTERKRAEDEVRRLNANLERQVWLRTEKLAMSEERFRLIAENMRDLLCMVDPAELFAYVSSSFGSTLGYMVEELLGRSALEHVHTEDSARMGVSLRRVLDGGLGEPREFRFRHKAGHYVWLEAVASVIRSAAGEIKGCVVTARDITERKLAAEQLHASESRYAHLVENINDAIIRDDPAGRVVFANRRFLEWFGLAGRDLQTVAIEDYVAPEWRERLRDRHDRRVRGEAVPDRFEYEGLRADGRRMWLDVFVTRIEEQGRIVGTQSVLRDITARKQTEQAAQAVLRKTAAVVGMPFFSTLASELSQVLDVAVVCIARASAPGRIAALAHYNAGRLLEPREMEIAPGHPCAQVLATGEMVLIPSGLRAKFSSEICGRDDLEGYLGIPLRTSGEQTRGLLIVASTRPLQLDPLLLSLLNILAMRTEAEFLREQAEKEKGEMQTRLFQSQKYEALGTLAGGVAHDFNNILTGVLNYSTLAQMDCPASHPQIREYLGEVLKCGQRAKELVRQILIFSRSESADLEPILLQLVVKEALSLLRSTLPATVEIRSEIDWQAPVVHANATQIHQVVMNLGINAAQAMPQQKGVLSIRLAQRMLDESAVRSRPELKPGPHVYLEVSDNGSGIEAAVLGRIFEPFFTTKKQGEGTGLGLAVVHSVVRSHEGTIAVRSQPGVGTTFEILLPVQQNATVGLDAEECAGLPRGKGQHILLVDDEATVGRSLQLTLERLGYRVTAFSSPEVALGRYWAAPESFDIVITDLQMPGMTGDELARRILLKHSGLPVFIASGFWGKLSPERLRLEGVAGTFHKPVDMKEVAEALARLPGAAGHPSI